MRDSLSEALTDGSRGVTAKVRWLSSASSSTNAETEGRPRWIHCTPLLGASGAVGVWMVVLVDDAKDQPPARRFRQAPPVADARPRQQQQQKHPGGNSLENDADVDTAGARYQQHAREASRGSSHGGRGGGMRGEEMRQAQRSYSPAVHKSNRSADPSIKSFAI